MVDKEPGFETITNPDTGQKTAVPAGIKTRHDFEIEQEIKGHLRQVSEEKRLGLEHQRVFPHKGQRVPESPESKPPGGR